MSASFHLLRVALVGSSLTGGGAEKQTVYIARALLQSGIDVRFFHLGAGGKYEPVLRDMKVPVCQIYFPNRPWKILAKLTGALRRWQPHIVLVNQFGDLPYGGIAGRCCHALVLGGVRSDGWYELRTHGRLSRFMVRLTHGLISNSQHARQALVSQRVNPQKIEVFPNVIDLRDFDARSALPFSVSLPAERIIVAAVGNLHPCKRFDRFLDALAQARRISPEGAALAGVIAGADYGEKAALQERARRLDLGSQDLLFLGACDEVPALLGRAALLVLCSEYEGFPNVILEAMAARLPVITTPAGDAGLVVQHDKTGYVVAPDDPRGMTAAMLRLAQSPALRLRFGEAGRKRVEQDYDYESLTDRLLGLFRRFAEQRPASSLIEMLERSVSGRKTNADDGALGSSAPLMSVAP